MSAPEGYSKLPAGAVCKCFKMWRETDGSHWCCLPKKRPEAAIENLTHHQIQCDMDGVMIQVSRQALCEVLDYLNASVVPRPHRGEVG